MQKNHLTFSISIYNKTVNKVVIVDIYFNIVRATYEKPRVNIILGVTKLRTFPLKLGTMYPLSLLLFNTVLGVLARELGKKINKALKLERKK